MRFSQPDLLAWAHAQDDAVELRVTDALTGEPPPGVRAANGIYRRHRGGRVVPAAA